MINSLFTGNRNSLLAWPWLFPDKQQSQPVFSNQPLIPQNTLNPMPFEGNMGGPSKGPGVMAGGMPYPMPGASPTGYGGLNTGQAPMQYGSHQASGGMRRPGGMAIRQKY